MAGALLAASTALSIWAAIERKKAIELQGRAESQELLNRAEFLRFDKASIDLQAQTEETQAALEEEDRQRQLRSVLSSQEAAFGSSGFASSGSFLATSQAGFSSVLRQTRVSKIQSGIRETQRKTQQKRIDQQIKSLKFQSKMAKKIAGIQGTASLISGLIGAAGSLGAASSSSKGG